MHCPQCRVELKPSKMRGELVDRCVRCHGIWMDEGELSRVLEQPSITKQHPVIVDPGRDAGADDDEWLCPICGESLQPTSYAYDSGVEIRKCLKCRGSWLQKGQVAAIEVYRQGRDSVNRLADAMGEEIGRANYVSPLWRLATSRWVSGAVALGYLSLMISSAGLEALRAVMFLIVPLACIWFPEIVTRVRPRSGLARAAESEIHRAFMVIVGWFLLLMPLVFLGFRWLATL